MSVKEWSSRQNAQAQNKPDDKPKDAPAVDQPPAQPEKTPTGVTSAPKS